MICWHCYWGWAEPVADLYDALIEEVGGSVADYGPGHIVWADENFEDSSIQWCINYCDNIPAADRDRWSADEVAAVRDSLVALLAIPADVRCEPEDYDEENPEMFPPKFATRRKR